MEIEYRSNYFSDLKATRSFEQYAKEIHDLDFSLWKARGLWDKNYVAYSAFMGSKCLASICVYPSEMIIGGAKKKGAQLLTVGTLPEYRLNGIQKEIWKRVQDWTNQTCDFVFLFTDDDAAGFYEKMGLRQQPEYIETTKCLLQSTHGKPQLKQLNIENVDDYKIIERLSSEREMVSSKVGFKNPNLLMFMLLYVYADNIFYIEDIDTVIVIEQTEARLLVHDIVAKKMPRFSEIEFLLSQFGKEEVNFLFCTDRLGVDQPDRTKVNGSILFVSKNFPLEGEYIFPFSIRA
jgi:GNAT superfamily N-acetyltransferase